MPFSATLEKPVYRGCFTLIYAYGLRIVQETFRIGFAMREVLSLVSSCLRSRRVVSQSRPSS
jgi:hypothetical protein